MPKNVKPQTKTSNRSKKLIYAAVALIIVLIPAVYFYSVSLTQPGEAKAAIIDQLGSSKLDKAIRDENQTFLESAKELLYKRFSIIDYYSDNATVEQYSKLASAGYKLILWRAHSALDLKNKYIAISTTDKDGSINYDQYPGDSLTLCNITGDPTLYVAITPIFIEQAMTGRFQDTVIVLMSCNGLQQHYLKTAQAFEAKGAKVIISWDNWISTSDNDYATSLLLQYLIDENNTVSVAVSKIPLSSSPEFGLARLQYDPVNSDVGNYVIPNYRKHDSANSALMNVPVSEKVEDPRGTRF
ncbi:MAG: hypothetical protein ABSB28_08755 [Candidatus Bathyarchaeia archaeon]